MSVLQGLVIVAEAADRHAMETVDIFDINIEIAHQISCEVEFSQFKEQPVFVEGVGGVNHHKNEVGIPVGRKKLFGNGVAVVEHNASSVPHVTQIKFSPT